MLNNTMTLKSGLEVTEGYWKWHHSIDRIEVPIHFPQKISVSSNVTEIFSIKLLNVG